MSSSVRGWGLGRSGARQPRSPGALRLCGRPRSGQGQGPKTRSGGSVLSRRNWVRLNPALTGRSRGQKLRRKPAQRSPAHAWSRSSDEKVSLSFPLSGVKRVLPRGRGSKRTSLPRGAMRRTHRRLRTRFQKTRRGRPRLAAARSSAALDLRSIAATLGATCRANPTGRVRSRHARLRTAACRYSRLATLPSCPGRAFSRSRKRQ